MTTQNIVNTTALDNDKMQKDHVVMIDELVYWKGMGYSCVWMSST